MTLLVALKDSWILPEVLGPLPLEIIILVDLRMVLLERP